MKLLCGRYDRLASPSDINHPSFILYSGVKVSCEELHCPGVLFLVWVYSWVWTGCVNVMLNCLCRTWRNLQKWNWPSFASVWRAQSRPHLYVLSQKNRQRMLSYLNFLNFRWSFDVPLMYIFMFLPSFSVLLSLPASLRRLQTTIFTGKRAPG